MIVKPLEKSVELKVYNYLNKRGQLTQKEQRYYHNLEKGYEGELLFATRLAGYTNDWLILHDLLLECSNTLFHIDTLLLSQNNLYLFEVKNFEGDYYIDGDKMFLTSEGEIKNPVLQLQRSESLLRQLLQKQGITLSIEAKIIFINSNFTLYQAPRNLPAIFPTQLNKYLNVLESSHSKLTKKHYAIAEQLVAMHINESPYSRLLTYSYEKLKKGTPCSKCDSFLTSLNRTTMACEKCGCKEPIESAIMRVVEEFMILFPGEKVTTSAIYDFCGVVESKKQITRILAKKLKPDGIGRATYYVKL